MVNQLFGINDTVENYRQYDVIRTINPEIFCDHNQINWNVVAGQRVIGSLGTSDDENRIDFCDFAKAVTGDYLVNTAQLVGDCVGASYEVATEHLNCYEIWSGELQVFHQHFRPWVYGTGRVYIGKGQLRGGDGSITAWQIKAGAVYGILKEGLEGLPKYTKAIAKTWGDSKAALDPWIDHAKDFLVTKSIEINSFDELCDVMIKGKMPVVIASNQGFRMELKQDNKAKKSWFVPSGNWGHQMSILACEKGGSYPGARVHNQWGLNAHPGQLDGPDGTGWVTPEFFNKWVRQGDAICVGIGNFNGWKWGDDDISISPFK
jgi:hypothetical protein